MHLDQELVILGEEGSEASKYARAAEGHHGGIKGNTAPKSLENLDGGKEEINTMARMARVFKVPSSPSHPSNHILSPTLHLRSRITNDLDIFIFSPFPSRD